MTHFYKFNLTHISAPMYTMMQMLYHCYLNWTHRRFLSLAQHRNSACAAFYSNSADHCIVFGECKLLQAVFLHEAACLWLHLDYIPSILNIACYGHSPLCKCYVVMPAGLFHFPLFCLTLSHLCSETSYSN